jgi:hypothetical protein
MQSHHESSLRSSAATLLGTNGGSVIQHPTRYPALVAGNGGTDLGMSTIYHLFYICY